jgi:hypothetical protein
MSLLDEIIKAITETDEKTSSILRKALVLSYRLKNDALKSWVSKELNGYDGRVFADGTCVYQAQEMKVSLISATA